MEYGGGVLLCGKIVLLCVKLKENTITRQNTKKSSCYYSGGGILTDRYFRGGDYFTLGKWWLKELVINKMINDELKRLVATRDKFDGDYL